MHLILVVPVYSLQGVILYDTKNHQPFIYILFTSNCQIIFILQSINFRYFCTFVARNIQIILSREAREQKHFRLCQSTFRYMQGCTL